MKLTVKEYSQKYNKSLDSVYKRISRGSLKCIIENNIKYVIDDDISHNIESKTSTIEVQLLRELIKSKDEVIEAHTSEIKSLKDGIENLKTMLATYTNLFNNQLEHKSNDDVVVEADDEPKKKKKSKKKGKKSKKKHS